MCFKALHSSAVQRLAFLWEGSCREEGTFGVLALLYGAGRCWEVPGPLAQMWTGWMKAIPSWQHSDGCRLPLGLSVGRHQGVAGSGEGPVGTTAATFGLLVQSCCKLCFFQEWLQIHVVCDLS